MSTPHAKKRDARVFVPHPDDVDDVRASVEAIERGEVLSPEASAAYLRSLAEDNPPTK